MISEIDAAWAAGFFDGEGSISIRRTWSKATNRKVYGLYLRASQVEREPLDKMRRIFGFGAIRATKQRRRNAPCFDWVLTGTKAADAVATMLPHLTVKRERSLLAVEFQKLTGSRRSGPRLSDQEMLIRHEFWMRMRYLNLRQVARLAAAETKSEGLERGCDSPACNDGKVAERGRNDHAIRLVS